MPYDISLVEFWDRGSNRRRKEHVFGARCGLPRSSSTTVDEEAEIRRDQNIWNGEPLDLSKLHSLLQPQLKKNRGRLIFDIQEFWNAKDECLFGAANESKMTTEVHTLEKMVIPSDDRLKRIDERIAAL